MPITVSSSAMSDKNLEEEVDEDLVEFEKFMMDKVDGSGPLHGAEKAIIKTYLYWKTHAEEASSTL